ncbi:unnamed protein product [Gordionus sp. m RMFG-2023]
MKSFTSVLLFLAIVLAFAMFQNGKVSAQFGLPYYGGLYGGYGGYGYPYGGYGGYGYGAYGGYPFYG